jgi:hypothetical protein
VCVVAKQDWIASSLVLHSLNWLLSFILFYRITDVIGNYFNIERLIITCVMFKMYCCRYNVRYGRVTASDEEVIEATRTADIHERILTFPDGTLVVM